LYKQFKLVVRYFFSTDCTQITQYQTKDVPSTSCWINCNVPEMTLFQRFGLWDEVRMPQCPLLHPNLVLSHYQVHPMR
jgi:hypothetical protein